MFIQLKNYSSLIKNVVRHHSNLTVEASSFLMQVNFMSSTKYIHEIRITKNTGMEKKNGLWKKLYYNAASERS